MIDRNILRDGVAAGSAAALVSGAPSAAHAILTGVQPLEASLAVGLIGRRIERIRALPLLPQVVDHVVYGATVGAVLRTRQRRRG